MFTKIAPKRFLFSIFLIIAFIGITLTNLKEADQLFAEIQTQADVNEFNTKYNVQLFLPKQAGA